MRTGLISLAVLACITAARADDWPVVRHDALNTGFTPTLLKVPLARAWSLSGATAEPVIVAGNTLLYTARKGKMGLRDLVAVNATTGKPLWTSPNVAQTGAASASLKMAFTVQRMSSQPTSVSRIGANLWPASIVGLDLKTGKRLWDYPVGDHPTYPAISPVTVAGDAVYVVNIPYCVPGDPWPPASVIELNARDGSLVAKYEWKAVYNGQPGLVDGPPLVDKKNNQLVVALGYNSAPHTPAGQLWFFPADEKLADGTLFRLGDPGPEAGSPAADAHKYGDSWPMKAGAYLAVQGPRADAQSWQITGNTAEPIWETRFNKDAAHSLLRGGSNPMVLEYNGGIELLTAMLAADAKTAWTRAVRATAMSATAGSIVFVPAEAKRPTDGTLYALDALTGKVLWSETRPKARFNSPVPANNRLYVTDSNGVLTCYAPGPAPKPAKAKPSKRRK